MKTPKDFILEELRRENISVGAFKIIIECLITSILNKKLADISSVKYEFFKYLNSMGKTLENKIIEFENLSYAQIEKRIDDEINEYLQEIINENT